MNQFNVALGTTTQLASHTVHTLTLGVPYDYKGDPAVCRYVNRQGVLHCEYAYTLCAIVAMPAIGHVC